MRPRAGAGTQHQENTRRADRLARRPPRAGRPGGARRVAGAPPPRMGGGWRRPQRGGHGPPRPGADAGTGDTGPPRNAHPRPGGGLDAPTDGRDAQPAGRRQPGSGNGHGAAAPSQANERPAPRRGRPAADGSRAADCNAARIPLSRVGASASSGIADGGRAPPFSGGTPCRRHKVQA